MRMRDIHTIYSQLKQENSQLKTQLHDVTEELNQIQKQYQNRYEELPIPCITVNCWGDILECNHIACVFFGKKSKSLCMDNLMKFLDANSRGRMNLFLQMMMEERLRSKIEPSDLEMDFFVRGRRYETIVRYNLILRNKEPLLELSILDMSEEQREERNEVSQHAWYRLALQNSGEYLIEYDQSSDELREYGDFSNSNIPKNEKIIKKNFLQQVMQCQREWTYSYQLMKDIFLGKKKSGELNLSEIDYYNFYGWAYLEMAPKDTVGSNSFMIGRLCDITERKVRELREKESTCKDKITKFYHSEYGLNLLIRRLETGKIQKRADHLILVSMNVTERMMRVYGAPFLSGSLYLMGQCLKQLQQEEGGTIIRVGEKEFLILLDDRTKEEALQMIETLRKQLEKNYGGNEIHGVIEYKVVLKPTISWSQYPDWRLVIQDLYEQGMKAKEGVIIVESEVDHTFCRKEPFVIEEYEGTTQIINKEQPSFFSYACGLMEHSVQIECAISLLLNIVGVLKQLHFIYIYKWESKQGIQSLLYQWEKEDEGASPSYDLNDLWKCSESGQMEQQEEKLYWKFNNIKNDTKKVIIYGLSKDDNMQIEEGQGYEELSNLLFLAMQYESFQVATKALEEDIQLLKQLLKKSKETSYDKILQKMEETIGNL